MKFANRLERVNVSATLALNAKTLELRSKGIDVISLAVGEPDFDTPAHIAEAAKKAIDEGFTRYTAVEGIPEARQAACEYYRRLYGVNANPSQFIFTNGGKQSLYNLFLCLLNGNDEILIPAPYWTSYPDMVNLVGANPVIVPCSSDRGFRICVEDLEKARTPQTKVLLLNSPSNPTGVTYTKEELDSIMTWAMANNIFVIADEVYDQLVYTPAKFSSVSEWWQKYPEKIAVVNSLAKSFAMTGWRVGFTLADEKLIKQMTKIQGQTSSNICSIAQKAAVIALSSSYDCVDEMRQVFARRRDFAYEKITSWKKAICPKPEGAFYLFPDMSAYFNSTIPDSQSLCTYILEEAKVALMPGEAFGDPKCMRFSYAVADEVLAKALDNIYIALQKI